MVTSHDVARLAGVSQPTVSRALRDSRKVSEATKVRVREAAKALGYVAERDRAGALDRALDADRAGRHRPGEPVLRPRRSRRCTTSSRRWATSWCWSPSPAAARRWPTGPRRTGLSAVVLATTTLDSILPVRLRDRGIPFVYFNRTAPSVEADSVTVDPGAGPAGAARGRDRAGATGASARSSARATPAPARQREHVARSVLDEHGLQLAHRDVLHGPFDFATGYAGMSDAARARRPADGDRLRQRRGGAGRRSTPRPSSASRCPAQVSVVGFDDLPDVRLGAGPADHRRLRPRRRGAGGGPARRRAGGRPAAEYRHVVHPTRYVARATIGAPAATEPRRGGLVPRCAYAYTPGVRHGLLEGRTCRSTRSPTSPTPTPTTSSARSPT